MPRNADVRAAGERIETLLDELRGSTDPRAAQAARELVGTLIELYGEGLAHVVDIAGDPGRGGGPALMAALVADPLVESLLLVHDLHPRNQRPEPPSPTRVPLITAGPARSAGPKLPRIGRRPPDPPLLQIGRRPPDPPAPMPAARVAAALDGGLERCELCATPLDDRHGHLVDLERRSLACACRACYLLFTAPSTTTPGATTPGATAPGARGGRYRAVPEDVHHDPTHPLTVADWAALGIPVGTAFFFHNSGLGRIVGCYPSPGGATETEVDLAEWDRLAGECPLLGALSPDVQAIFVHREADRVDYFRVPIDTCYALVGEVRKRWRGLDGGEEVRGALATFLDGLRERARRWDKTTDATTHATAQPWPA